MAWVNIVPAEEAEGKLKELYEALRASGGDRFAEVQGVFTHHPDLLAAHRSIGPDRIYALDGFDRVLAESIAVTVSVINRCHY